LRFPVLKKDQLQLAKRITVKKMGENDSRKSQKQRESHECSSILRSLFLVNDGKLIPAWDLVVDFDAAFEVTFLIRLLSFFLWVG